MGGAANTTLAVGRIKSIRLVGPRQVWDISVATDHSYLAQGFVNHNSSDENLQNIPKKLASVNIKGIFVPDDDTYLFANCDAKGAEVRVLTAYCHDGQLIQSLNDGMDTHSFFANKIVDAVMQDSNAVEVLTSMGLVGDHKWAYADFADRDAVKALDKVYGEMLIKFRDAVKRVVFGMLYGAGPRKIAETIGISETQASNIIDLLFSLFPSIPAYIAQTKWELRTFGFVETFFGRRRRFGVQGASNYLKSRAERQTVNFKIQSTSSEIVMSAMVDLDAPLRRDLGGRILLTVHDSIAFQLPKKYASQLGDFVEEHLEKNTGKRFPWMPVAFKWDCEVGPSYGELMPYKQYMEKITPKEEIRNEAKEAYTEEEIRTTLADPDEAAA